MTVVEGEKRSLVTSLLALRPAGPLPLAHPMPLASQRYGKDRVRVLRVVRGAGGVHDVHEVEVSVSLEGDFADTYLTGDNGRVVPTDTMKNTVQVLAQQYLDAVPEGFALALSKHFLKQYDQVVRVRVEVAVQPWDRYTPTGGGAHPHTFTGRAAGAPFTRVEVARGGDDAEIRVESGLRDVLLLKSTASAFKGFPRCDFTTLPESDDRILATKMAAAWTFSRRDVDYTRVNAAITGALLDTFAREFSPSVQNTLFLMGEAALAAAPDVSEIHLAMPNKHYLPVNFQPFGRENAGEIFLPTDEPHGQIEARIVRAAAAVPA